MNAKELIKRIEEVFIQKLQQKTGWGKNEIICLHKEAVNEVILELAETIIVK